MKEIQSAVARIQSELIEFARDLVRIQSYSGEEEKIIRFIEGKMRQLDYDEVMTDSMGNLMGRMGRGEKSLMFDSHVDTVRAGDRAKWIHDPFAAVIEDGRLFGRGSVDMKSGAAASIYAGALAKKMNLLGDKTLYVSCTVMEEDCDGENLNHLFRETQIRPQAVIICEPSDNRLVTGHKGKAQIALKTRGISAHGSAPEKGKNAIYEMAEIITRIQRTGNRLMDARGPRGTLVASRISSQSESLNAVPFECEIYLDRRMGKGETRQTLENEMDAIVAGKNATWEIGTLNRRSWTGMDVTYHPFHPAWEIQMDHPLARTCSEAFRTVFGTDPEPDYWDFSTNAVTPVAMGIPTIGFGPGEYKLAHMVNENCEIRKIAEACAFYAAVMDRF